MARSIEDEICALAQTDHVADAVHKLGLLSPQAQLEDIVLRQDWHRSGAETYLLRCAMRRCDGAAIELVLKACIGLSEQMSVERTLDEWIRRRRLLDDAGVNTPHLYAYANGVLLEEFIALPLRKAMTKSIDTARGIVLDVAKTAAIVAANGFRPISFFDDLRSRGNDAVLVDFGSDLGPENKRSSEYTHIRCAFAGFLRSTHYDDVTEALQWFAQFFVLCKDTSGHD